MNAKLIALTGASRITKLALQRAVATGGPGVTGGLEVRMYRSDGRQRNFCNGSSTERLRVSISRLLFLMKADAAGPCHGPPARARLARVANVRLLIPIPAFRAQGRLRQLSATS